MHTTPHARVPVAAATASRRAQAWGRMRTLGDSDRILLAGIAREFAGIARPTHFTDFAHCAECAAHDERLQACAPSNLGLEDVAYAAGDPFCVTKPAGFLYFFPALARLALAPPSGEHGWYGAQLLFHLAPARRENGFFDACSPAQRAAVARFLRHLLDTRASLAGEDGVTGMLLDTYGLWAAAQRRLLLN